MVNILQNKILKRVAIAIAAMLVVAVIAVGTGFLLTHITQPAKQAEKSLSKAEIDQQMDIGRQKVMSGTDKASKGETDAAISLYKDAVSNFQEAGDKASVDAVELEIVYLEKVKTMSPNPPSGTNSSNNAVTTTPTPADPTKDPGYGVTATYPSEIHLP